MDHSALLKKFFWNLRQPWHFRHQPDPAALSVSDTVKGLQALLLAEQGAFLVHTLRAVWRRDVILEELEQLIIAFYQEGADQRVWRVQATLTDGSTHPFGIIVARAPGRSSELTQRDFTNLRQLQAQLPRACVTPHVWGMLATDVTAFTVEWLEQYQELVFDITRNGGVFLVNAVGMRHAFSPQMSRRIWRRIMAILSAYPGLRAVNIQAGDFVGHPLDNGADIDLKLTTARELRPDSGPVARIHDMLGYAITASGYLSDGKQPFDRHLNEKEFMHRMHAVLRRRFGEQAHNRARQQWTLFQQGALARQEDELKDDCILATYDHLSTEAAAEPAWRETRQRWMAYAAAVQAGTLPPSWWFPAAELPLVLNRLANPSDLR